MVRADPEGFRALVAGALPVADHLLQSVTAASDLHDPRARSRALKNTRRSKPPSTHVALQHLAVGHDGAADKPFQGSIKHPFKRQMVTNNKCLFQKPQIGGLISQSAPPHKYNQVQVQQVNQNAI